MDKYKESKGTLLLGLQGIGRSSIHLPALFCLMNVANEKAQKNWEI
ncbi:hypothetical protein ACVRXF_01780 [Streptococcus orisasini]